MIDRHDTATDIGPAIWKVLVAWGLTIFGNVTLQQVATFLAIVYTLIQIYILVRDKIVRDKGGAG